MHVTPRRLRARPLAAALVLTAFAVGLPGCIGAPASTDQVVKIASQTVDGWQYDQYRNLAYPCSISGYQTFVIGTKVGSSATATRPLWVKMRGGGHGWFDTTGKPQPTAGNKSEESFATSLGFDTGGLMAKAKADPAGFRVLIVSMCSHDVYAGDNTPDPNNPNRTPDGKLRPTTGLVATKAAIQYTLEHYPTDDYFLHGTSAGGAGAFNVAWGMQMQRQAPDGIVADSGVLNQAWEVASVQQGLCPSGETLDDGQIFLRRIAPEIADVPNQPHLLIERGDLTVPVAHVWNRADKNSCYDTSMACPLPDGSTATMGAAECRHLPLREAIAAQGASSRSKDFRVCVEGDNTAIACDRHVVTGVTNGVNTDPSTSADYNSAVFAWVKARMADD